MAGADDYRSGDALFVVDEELRITAWNTEAEKLTGVPAEAALGNRCWSILAGTEDDGAVVCNAGCPVAREGLRRGEVASRLLLIRTSAGTRRVVASTISVGAGEARRLVHLLRPAPLEESRTAAPPELERLTAREREVFDLLRGGLDAAAIASALGISVATVRTHIRHILGTLGVHSQLAAVASARRQL
jgi:PAS domain S-box-containing protein